MAMIMVRMTVVQVAVGALVMMARVGVGGTFTVDGAHHVVCSYICKKARLFMLTISPLNKLSLSANLSSALISKVFQYRSKLVKLLSECQTALIWLRCRVPWRLIYISKLFDTGLQLLLAG